LHYAEQRRHKGGFSNRLFEPLGEFPIAAFMLSSAREPLGRGVGVPFSLVTFGAKDAVKQRALGGHAKYWYILGS
jgi:hypothetical protein